MEPNPKIKELIKSLGIIPEDEHYEVAELLIEECCQQFVEHPYVGAKRTQYIYGYIQGRADAIRSIKEHFGVE